jgi:general secretion pathway protein D
VLALLVSGCASALSRARQADEAQDYDLAIARYAAILREAPDNREAQQGLERSKLRAAQQHFQRGRRMAAQGRYEDAELELQLATELNPTDPDAADALREVRLALRRQLAESQGRRTELEQLLARTRDLPPAGFELPELLLPSQIAVGQQSTARTLYLTIGQLANLSVTFASEFVDVPAPGSLLNGLSLRAALDAIAASTNTFYQVTAPNTIVVAPDTPSARREYVGEVLRQFPLQNADIKETIDALRVVADARFVSALTGTNTILVRDTPERVQVIGRWIEAIDKARPEIVVDVEVLEVDRLRFREYGLQFASPGSTGIDGAADVNQEDGISLESLRNLSQANVLMTNIPALYYRLLKTDTRTRTLANPHVRMSDGVAARADFGTEVPVPSLTIAPITQGGINIQPQTQFEYRTIGVSLSMTPRTHANGDITLALTVELSSLGAPGFNGLPTFGTRRVETAIRLKDGETNILAGLIREDERAERQTIPGLGEVPVLGHVFGRNRREAEQTDVVIMLTPHIIRTLDLIDEDLRPLRLPNEGLGGILLEPTPILPPSSAEPRDPVPPAVPPVGAPDPDQD